MSGIITMTDGVISIDDKPVADYDQDTATIKLRPGQWRVRDQVEEWVAASAGLVDEKDAEEAPAETTTANTGRESTPVNIDALKGHTGDKGDEYVRYLHENDFDEFKRVYGCDGTKDADGLYNAERKTCLTNKTLRRRVNN